MVYTVALHHNTKAYNFYDNTSQDGDLLINVLLICLYQSISLNITLAHHSLVVKVSG